MTIFDTIQQRNRWENEMNQMINLYMKDINLTIIQQKYTA